MAKTQPVWALDVGQAALKALKLIPGETPDQVIAEAFDYIEYPKILSQPDADPDQLVREALETFLERNELKGCKVAISVPGQAGLVKFIKLPPVEKKRIPDIVQFDPQMLFLAVGLSLAAGLIAGAYPAWRVCRIAPAIHLKVQ